MAITAVVQRKIRIFLGLPALTKLWIIPVWVLLGISKFMIFNIEFRRFAPMFGKRSALAPWVPLLTPKQEQRALLIGRMVRMTAKYTPWDSNCFPQAIVARLLLGLYGVPYVFYFGLQRKPDNPGKTNAHAWVVAGRVNVTGGMSFRQFTVVGCYRSPLLAEAGAL